MALELYELAIRFKSEGFKAVSRDMDTLDKKGKGISKAFTALKASLIVGAVGGFIRKIAVESIEAQKQAAQLNAVIKSTGGVAGVTADDIDKMAGSLQKETTFSDEAVKSAASLLLTFTSVRGEIFRQTLPAITDMATALGTDLNTATLQVGKALQDPVRGITALRRAGVSFSEAQQNVIKNLVATNRLAEAQGIILKELSVQFGGSAQAARNTLGGALAGLSNAWGDLFEVTQDKSKGIVGFINDIADALPNARSKIDTAFSGFLQWVREVEERLAKVQKIAFAINRFFGGNAGAPSGPAAVGEVTLGGENIALPKPSKVAPFGGGSGGAGAGPKIPGFDMSSSGQAQIDMIGTDPERAALVGMSGEQLADMLSKWRENREWLTDQRIKIEEAEAEKLKAANEALWADVGNTLGDAVYNAFSAAFNGEGIGGIFAAFGKTILAGLGNIIVQQGQALLSYGIAMQAAAWGLTNPFTAGPAAIAAGAALIALGSAFGAIAKGGGGRGTAQAGAFRERSSDVVRLKFLDRPGYASQLSPVQPIVINAYGPNDPKTQRWMLESLAKATRR